MYRINEIFSSLQGEGHNTGRAATFVRFAGCNLRCPFCDTDFSEYREMSAEDIVDAVITYPTRFVVLTGGEPALQMDDALVSALHEAGFTIAVETNGTRLLPKGIDWVTVSPKQPLSTTPLPQLEKGRVNEIKVVFDGTANPEEFIKFRDESLEMGAEKTQDPFHDIPSPPTGESQREAAPLLFLQPCDVGNPQQNAEITRQCIEYIIEHPWWRLSLQTHKMGNFK